MNSLRQTKRLFVALTVAAFLFIQVVPALASFQINDAGRWATTLVNCDGDNCG